MIPGFTSKTSCEVVAQVDWNRPGIVLRIGMAGGTSARGRMDEMLALAFMK